MRREIKRNVEVIDEIIFICDCCNDPIESDNVCDMNLSTNIIGGHLMMSENYNQLIGIGFQGWDFHIKCIEKMLNKYHLEEKEVKSLN